MHIFIARSWVDLHLFISFSHFNNEMLGWLMNALACCTCSLVYYVYDGTLKIYC